MTGFGLGYRHTSDGSLHLLQSFLSSMLTGSELLSKVKELGDVSKSDLVRSTGYVSTKKDGTERLNFTAFYEAMLVSKGLSLGNDGVGVFSHQVIQ